MRNKYILLNGITIYGAHSANKFQAMKQVYVCFLSDQPHTRIFSAILLLVLCNIRNDRWCTHQTVDTRQAQQMRTTSKYVLCSWGGLLKYLNYTYTHTTHKCDTRTCSHSNALPGSKSRKKRQKTSYFKQAASVKTSANNLGWFNLNWLKFDRCGAPIHSFMALLYWTGHWRRNDPCLFCLHRQTWSPDRPYAYTMCLQPLHNRNTGRYFTLGL